MKTAIVVAASENDVIGYKNSMPWKLAGDLAFFKHLTINSPVLMGKNTFLSLSYKPLPERENIILSRTLDQQVVNEHGNLHIAHDMKKSFEIAQNLIDKQKLNDTMYIIGGAQVFSEVINMVDTIYLTRVKAFVKGEVFLPAFSKVKYKLIQKLDFVADERNEYDYDVEVWRRVAT